MGKELQGFLLRNGSNHNHLVLNVNKCIITKGYSVLYDEISKNIT